MSSHYKENNFSTESSSSPFAKSLNNKNETARPNIDHLIKRIIVEKRKEKMRNIISFGIIILSIILIFIFKS